MGYQDRDYYRDPRSSSRGYDSIAAWSVTTWLIAINVAVFILDQITRRAIYELGYFSADTAIGQLQVWRFLTFQFLHADLTHIFFNMLSLYYFGPIIESYLGARRFLAFYLLCGLSGVALYLLLMIVHVLDVSPATPLLGALAGIFGVLLAASQIAPNAAVMLMFPPIPMKLRTMAWVMVGISVYTILQSGHNAGGEAGHLGGAALGYLLIRRPDLLNVFANWPRPRGPRKGW